MGSKSGWAHALGCPEWVPPGAGSREGVLGTLWWFPFPSGPILAIHADTDQIPTHTCLYTQIPANIYRYLHMHADLELETAISRQPVIRLRRAKEQY